MSRKSGVAIATLFTSATSECSASETSMLSCGGFVTQYAISTPISTPAFTHFNFKFSTPSIYPLNTLSLPLNYQSLHTRTRTINYVYKPCLQQVQDVGL